MLKRIVITPGEPAGIGPDLTLLMAQEHWGVELVTIADPSLLLQRASQIGKRITLREFKPDAPPGRHEPGTLKVWPITLKTACESGVLKPTNASYVLETLRIAANSCRDNTFSALVTGPVQKSTINDAGIAFTGHTEFLAQLVGGNPVMLLAAGALRVALTTTHIPLAKVSNAITPKRLESVIHVLHHDLRTRFGIDNPRITVCGLNPHAGEEGHLGREEIEVIIPTLNALRKNGIELVGPLPADTVFVPRFLNNTDAILAMYHDQGLPVLKHAGFGRAVNITLGLPIIRTSVDHGTALELAGSGKADAGSLKSALQLAIDLATRSKK